MFAPPSAARVRSMSTGLRRLAVLVACCVLGVACSTSVPTQTSTSNPTEPAPVTTEQDAEPPAVEASEPAVEAGEPAVTADEPEPADTIEDAASGIETIDWRACGELTECGTIVVPADYNDPSAGVLTIAVNIHRAEDVNERIGYLLVNPGGPGVPGLGLVENATGVFTGELLESFDIVGFDPRGVGASEPTFACGVGDEQGDLLAQIDDVPDTPEEIALGSQAAQLCIDSMGPVGARLHTEFVARDMDEIRIALGAEQISYLGFSYGSEVGGWYASLFPERVYSMAVDGAPNPLATFDDVEGALQLERESTGPFHERLAAAIASCDETCPIWNGGDPEGYWYGMVDKFDLVTAAKDGNPDAIGLSIFGHLYTDATWPALHQSIFDLAENDDPSGFVAAIDRAGDADGPSIVRHIRCLDEWALFPEIGLEEQVARNEAAADEIDALREQEYPLLFALELPEQVSSCLFYEAIDPPVFDGVYDGGGIPILVIGNTTDPATPFVRSEQFANAVLADGRLVKVQHSTHVVYPANPCVNDLIHSALIDQEYPAEEITCEAVAGMGEIALVPVELPDGSTSVRPDGWQEIGPGVYSSGANVVLFQPTDGDPDGFRVLFEQQLGGVASVPVGEMDINGVQWRFFALELPADGLSIRFGIRAGADGVVILGQSVPDDVDQLVEQVLQPAAEAFVPAG